MPSSDRSLGRGWIDSHCHLNDMSHAIEWMKQAEQSDIDRFIIPGTAPQQWPEVIAWQSARCAIALGTHPWFVDPSQNQAGQLVAALAQHSVVAIGEIGLDFYPSQSQPRPDKAVQQQLFEAQLQIATEHRLPVIVHSVKAHQQVIATLRRLDIHAGVIHAFVGSVELASQYIDLGFHLGVGPLILKSPKTRSALAQIPLSHLLLETDAPFSSSGPTAHRTNPLLDLVAVANCLAELKQLGLTQLQTQTRHNSQSLFGLSVD
ncbi:TatD family hydrolase [Reinekea sp.]|jgi:TatD DNase family protein|uniref:TatD family hydrolase n=1 Tax=Reinekea sp. TaxID=1970455 RepID=UPI002A7EBB3F|nr:TatD family hydrolase [Reinekea sp.]